MKCLLKRGEGAFYQNDVQQLSFGNFFCHYSKILTVV